MGKYYSLETLIEAKQKTWCDMCDLEDFLGEIPEDKVIEITRCKDCKWFNPYEGEEHKGECDELVGLESCVYEEDFCSYAEPK